VFALSGLAVAQPLLDVLGRSPEFFLFLGVGRAAVWSLLLAVTVAAPALLWGLTALVGLVGGRTRRAAHAVVVGALAAMLAVNAGKHLTAVRGVPLALLAVLAGAGFAAAHLRFSLPRQLLRFAAVGPLVFVLLFALASPASAVLSTGSGGSAGASSSSPSSSGGPPIVMIFLDEFPLASLLDGTGHIDSARFPNFARLAGDATWYRNATAAAGWTPYAVPAMLTGRFPHGTLAPHYSQYPDNLFTLLASNGYRLDVQESVTQLCPPALCDPAARAGGGASAMIRQTAHLLWQIVSPVDVPTGDPESSMHEPTTGAQSGPHSAQRGSAPSPSATGTAAPATHDTEFAFDRLADNQPARFTTFLAGLRAMRTEPGPSLHFVHMLLPHTPWQYLPSGMRYQGEEQPTEGDWFVRLGHDRHDLQVRYTDKLLGQALDALKATGRYDESMVVVTADHGVSFAGHSIYRGIGDHLQFAPEVSWVPLFIKAPGETAGRVDDRNWQHVDLVPTVAATAGVSVPWRVDGVSALGPARTDPAKVYYDDVDKRVVLDGAATLPRVLAMRASGPSTLRPDLVGRAAPAVAPTMAGARVSVDEAASYADVRRERLVIPALMTAHLSGRIPEGTPLAIALNGRIAAVVPAERVKGALRLFGILPESALVPGPNRVDIYAVGPGDALSLLPSDSR
jgi:hypothetical protein